MKASSHAFAARRLRHFGTLLLAAMAASTFAVSSLSILASSIIADLSISREQLGLVATVNVVLAAVLSPWAGNIVDRIGGRRGFLGIFWFGGLAFAIMSAAVAYWVLLAASVVAGFAQAAGNPATNKLIALHLPAGRRGLVTGIKQSGVQAALFLGGLLLPVGGQTIGWRPTLLVTGALTLSLIVPARRVVPEDRPVPSSGRGEVVSLPPSTPWLAAYGALLGFGGATFFFVPLFAQEAAGYGPGAAGLAAAVIGLVALGSRIAWARFAERGDRFVAALGAIALLAVGAASTFLVTSTASPLLWPAVLMMGVSSSAWNSVGMLAVMRDAGPERAGRASGYVMMGFLLGLGTAPPIYGRTVDVTGSYTVMWLLAAGVFIAASVVVLVWRRAAAHVTPGRLGDR